jgi:hypothetical protein
VLFDDDAKRESTWGTPLRILLIVFVFAFGFLYYYFGPSLNELQGNRPEASAVTTPVAIIIGGQKFVIPENFTQFPRARRGGARENVALYAMLPGYKPYTLANELTFESNEPDSPIIHFQLESIRSPFDEEDRIKRVYLPSVADTKGERALYGLTHYQFLDGSGYQDHDLYIGLDALGHRAALTCGKNVQNILPSSCRRHTWLTNKVMLNYRFKRSRLKDWKEIDSGVRELALSFLREDTVNASETEPSQ